MLLGPLLSPLHLLSMSTDQLDTLPAEFFTDILQVTPLEFQLE